jgi:hypothetical protein
MNKSILKLADLLPDNVSEDTMNKIIGVIQETITGEVSERIKVLEAKAGAFIRKNVDSLKAQAVAELTEENEIYQDAISFRKLKGIMGVDKPNIQEVKEHKQLSELEEENKVLYEHLNLLVEENTKFKKLAKSYKQKAILAESTLQESITEVQDLKESNAKPFKSSEKAIVISEGTVGEFKPGLSVNNPFLSDDVVALMPKGN